MVQRVKFVLEKPTTKAYLSVTLPIVNNFNKYVHAAAVSSCPHIAARVRWSYLKANVAIHEGQTRE